MPYPIFRSPTDPAQADHRRRAGEWWYAPWLLHEDGSRSSYLSPHYYEHNGHRPPLVVVCPDGSEFCVDSVVTSGGRLGDHGWQVSGSPEDGTLHVNPSINILGSYHGWLHAGVLSDDLDGRAGSHSERQARLAAIHANQATA